MTSSNYIQTKERVKKHLLANNLLAFPAIEDDNVREYLDPNFCLELASNHIELLQILLTDQRMQTNDWLAIIFQACLRNEEFCNQVLSNDQHLHRFTGKQLFDLTAQFPTMLSRILYKEASRTKYMLFLVSKVFLHPTIDIGKEYAVMLPQENISAAVSKALFECIDKNNDHIDDNLKNHLTAHLYILGYNVPYTALRDFIDKHGKWDYIAPISEEHEVEHDTFRSTVRSTVDRFLGVHPNLPPSVYAQVVDRILREEARILYEFIDGLDEDEDDCQSSLYDYVASSPLLKNFRTYYVGDRYLELHRAIGQLSLMTGHPEIALQYFENAASINVALLSSRKLLALGDLYLISSSDKQRQAETEQEHAQRLAKTFHYYELAEKKGNKNAQFLLAAIRKDLLEQCETTQNDQLFSLCLSIYL